MQKVRLLSRHCSSLTTLFYTLVGALLICTKSLYADAGSHDIAVTEQGGVYHIRASIVINAPADYVHQVLTDYVHIYRLNPSIVESEVLDSDEPGTTRVKTRVIGCAGYFCEELERVEKVRELSSGDLVADIIPGKSEFKSGRTVWHIESLGERSRIDYESEMEPDFYIPPVVGKFMAKKSIREGITASFKNLERIANVFAERDWVTDFRLSSLQPAAYTPCELAKR